MVKTKALISLAVTGKLICVFIFAYAKRWFSHDAATIIVVKYSDAGWAVHMLLEKDLCVHLLGHVR